MMVIGILLEFLVLCGVFCYWCLCVIFEFFIIVVFNGVVGSDFVVS